MHLYPIFLTRQATYTRLINSNSLNMRMANIGILLNLKISSTRHDKGVLSQIDKLASQSTLGIAKLVQLHAQRSCKLPLQILIFHQKIGFLFH